MSDTDFIEVYEVEPGKGRAYFTHKPGALEFLPTDPLPAVGDVLLLPKNLTCESDDQAFVMLGMLAPFRVVEREFLYYRDPDEEHDRVDTKPAKFLKVWLHVERLSKAQYAADPPIS